MIKRLSATVRYLAVLLMVITTVGNASAQYNKQLYNISKTAAIEEPEKLIARLNAIDKSVFSVADKALYNESLSYYYIATNEDDKAYSLLLDAKKYYISIDSTDAAMESVRKIYNALFYSDASNADPLPFAEDYLEYALKKNNKEYLENAYLMLADYYQADEKPGLSLDYYRKALKNAEYINDRKGISAIYNNLSLLFSEHLKQPDSAIHYLEKDLDYLKHTGDLEGISANYINQATGYYYNGDIKKAIGLMLMAHKLPLKKTRLKSRQATSANLSRFYSELGEYKNAFIYQALANKYTDSLKEQERGIAISDIESRYKAKERELENKVLKNDMKINRVVLYTVIGLAIAIVVISALVITNSRRKEKITRQEKLIEEQKLEKALKEHELQSIDFMLEGQERERRRIANDLHDNLGSMLATLKLNFENLKMRKNGNSETEDLLFERTDELIDEAYHKVRRLAHTKNAGVLATDGLIPAVKRLTEKITIPGKLDMQFIPYGFSERLDNTLEITIFRIIQELATNIIKHSKATEATIQLTNHDDAVNIIIEDNGIGFKPSEVKGSGMGMDTLNQKVAQLNGTLEIDSTPGRGTTIIIELPL